LSFAEIFGIGKLKSAWAIVWRGLRDPTFSHFRRAPTSDRQTHDYGITAYTALYAVVVYMSVCLSQVDVLLTRQLCKISTDIPRRAVSLR